ncbi:Haloacid dehalogenase-like hydrolase domain-containing protein 3 [Nymphaea thermarum]|nr:Haloacid dehalogenase-like hydrolase domain-containing protein 3 [Nymphaea thermarum]
MLRRFVEIRLAGPAAVNARNRAPDRVGSAFLDPYRRNLIPLSSMMTGACRQKTFDALLLDAGGTLLQTASPVAETYATIGKKYGIKTNATEIKEGFRRAFSASWPEKLRYQAGQTLISSYHVHVLTMEAMADGRPFWRHVVSEATGCSNNEYFEEVYEHFARSDAWRLPSGAYEVLHKLKDDGVKLAVISNFDTRLRKLLEGLNISNLFDAIIVSAEIGYEKPAAEIFRAALDQLCVEAGKAVHVGDDLKADKFGANAVGINCWLWGTEVKSFDEIYNRIMNVAVQKE